jgi:hypothetical protein
MNGPRHPANVRVGTSEAARAAGGDLLLGRARIAEAMNRSPRTVTRWAQAGRLNVAKLGEARNTLMLARRRDIEKARS